MGGTSREVTRLFANGFGVMLIVAAIVAGIAFTPYVLARTGYAAWLFAQSAAHPLIVGAALLLTGILLVQAMRRVFGQG
jgi:hypothetical protein